jgi:hypothetical protein
MESDGSGEILRGRCRRSTSSHVQPHYRRNVASVREWPPITEPELLVLRDVGRTLVRHVVQACYEQWSSRGAQFVTPPIDPGAEIRCYMRDPDGYLIEVGQATGLLEGKLAKKRPEDLPG